jgi:uncharacterized repeat protein (TIGR02543 family)
MKKFFLFLTAFLLALPLSVFSKATFSQDGFYFNEIRKDGYIVSVYVTRDDHSTSTDDEYNYSYLKHNVTIPSKIQYGKSEWPVVGIGKYAFANMKNAKEVILTFPSTIQTISSYAFKDATSLRSVTINEGVKTMESSAFEGCDHLVSINIPTTLSELPNDAFSRCESLKTIQIPATIKKIGSGAFAHCANLQTVEGAMGLVWAETIEMEAFYDCPNLQSITLSGALKSIGYASFSGCTSLKSIVLPVSLEKISDWAFSNSGIRNVTNYCQTPQTISANVFDGVDLSLCVLTVPKGSKTAYKNANVWKKFGQIVELGEKPIPAGEKQIDGLYYALRTDLTATLIYDDSYLNMSGTVSVPSEVTVDGYTYQVKHMGDGVFQNCKKITSVALPGSVTTISSNAFENCTALTTVTFSTALDTIKASAFRGCTSLQTPTLPSTLKSIGTYAFCDCKSLTYMNIPAGVLAIVDSCFAGCSKMEHFYLNEGILSIRKSAFANTALTTLTLPSTLKWFGDNVFDGCSKLESLRSMVAEPPTVEPNTLSGIDVTKCYLYVPAGSLEKYEAATYWNDFIYKQEKALKGKIQVDNLWFELKEDFTAAVTYETNKEDNYKDLVGEITVPDNVSYKGIQYKVTTIGYQAFKNAKNISVVNLPEDMDRIEYQAFSHTNVYDINIPATISYLYNKAFEESAIWVSNMDIQHTVYFDHCLLYHEQNYINGPINVEAGTRLIATNAFSGDQYITEVHIPEGVTCLCEGAIDWMPLLQVVSLPSTITYIGKGFINSTSVTYLKTIYNYMEEPYMAEGLFQGWGAEDKAKVTLYVPAGTKAAYEGTDVWGDFNIVEMEPIYTVVFEDANGNVLKTEKRQKGESATAPDAPNIVGYEFVGWDTDFTNIQSDLTVKPLYQLKTFTVTFVDKDDTELKKETVEYGKDATAPEPPVHEGYHFTGWNPSYEIVKADVTVKAQYDINTYTVTFVDWDDTELKKETVEHGKAATAPKDPERDGYTFTGWEPSDFTNVTSDLIVKAQYQQNITYYTVKFIDYDDTVLKTQKVAKGHDATPPEDPYRKGYIFIGWDEDYTNVQKNLDIYARYKIKPDEEALEDVQRDDVPCTKVIRDGQLYLIYNGTMYNVQGGTVK